MARRNILVGGEVPQLVLVVLDIEDGRTHRHRGEEGENEETHVRWILRNLYTLFRLWAKIDELPTIVATQVQEVFEGDFEGDFKGSSSGSFRCTWRGAHSVVGTPRGTLRRDFI